MPCHISETLPFTHEQAVNLLLKANWTQLERKTMLEGGLFNLHHNFGEHIRNSWHLWEPTSPLARHYQKVHGIGHADDMSSLIILDLLARMRGEVFNLASHVYRYRQFWLEQKIDPVSQREIH
jgi:hypothetical protein